MIFLMILLITSFTLISSEDLEYRASESDEGESDYGDMRQVLEEVKDQRGFSYKGILRLTFAFEVLQDIRSNVVCSPVAALLPLGKLILGATKKSLQELVGLIGIDNYYDEDGDEIQAPQVFRLLIQDLQNLPGAKLDLASRIYVSKEFKMKKKFLHDTWDVFKSSIEKVSFKKPVHVVDEINGWVSRQTKGKIPLVLSPEQVSPDSSSVIINAICFRGKWKYPFDKIEDGDFFAPSGQKTVQLMTRQGFFRYGKSSVLNAQIIEIPYKGLKSSFIVILPNENNGLAFLLNALRLAPMLLNNALRSMRKQLAIVSIPKFTIHSTLDIKDIFKKIGMEKTMSDTSGFTGIVKDELRISTAVQKAVIEVEPEIASNTPQESESGPVTETPDLDQITFIADHPFLFYVKANREQLMAGVFCEP